MASCLSGSDSQLGCDRWSGKSEIFCEPFESVWRLITHADRQVSIEELRTLEFQLNVFPTIKFHKQIPG
jgi:hypothetical protein